MDERIMRPREVAHAVGLSVVSIWRLGKKEKFPKKIKLGGNSVGYLKSEIQDWILKKAKERN